jgi:hypothetical protein
MAAGLDGGRMALGDAPLPLEELASHTLSDAKARPCIGEVKGDKRDEASARRRHCDVVPRNKDRTCADAKRGRHIQVQPRWCCTYDECPAAVPARPKMAGERGGGALKWACFIKLSESFPACDQSDAVADREPEGDEPDSGERNDAENEA